MLRDYFVSLPPALPCWDLAFEHRVGMTTQRKADVPESKDPIKIVMMGYSGDNIIMFIYGELIKKARLQCRIHTRRLYRPVHRCRSGR